MEMFIEGLVKFMVIGQLTFNSRRGAFFTFEGNGQELSVKGMIIEGRK
jgi:hypothetical protein